METLKKLLCSRQFWTLVALFVVNGVSGVKDVVPAGYLPYLDGFLGLMALYFRISPRQSFE